MILNTILNIIKTKQFYAPVVAIILGIVAYKVIKAALNRIIKVSNAKNTYEQKKRRTIVDLASNIAKYIIVVIVLIIILEAFNIDTASIIAGLGVVSAVIGLAFQDVLKDFISGVSIILENYYVVGDTVTYNGFMGEVVELGLKTTKIKKCTGEILIVANRNINEITNLSQCKQVLYLNISAAYEENTDKVIKVINDIIPKIEKLPNVVKGSVQLLGVNELACSAVIYQLKIDCIQDKQWAVKRETLKLIKDTFDAENISIPYPQVEVHYDK